MGPQVAFESGGVRVFGTVQGGRVALASGPAPAGVALHVPKHEFDKFAGDLNRSGSLLLFLSDPDAPDVTLAGWHVDYAADSIRGRRPGDDGAQVVEKTLYLLDRRWEFLDGRGGCVFAGLVNQSRKDGAGCRNVENPFHATAPEGASPHRLLRYLIGHLQYASGGERLSSDTLPTALMDLPPPRDLRWDGAHAPTEIVELLDRAGAALYLRPDGTYAVEMLGDGVAPDLPDADRLPSDVNYGATRRPGTVVVTSAPQRVVVQRTVLGAGQPLAGQIAWDWVGEETDGTLKPLADLSYVQASGKTPQELVRESFDSLSDAEFRLAVKSFYCVLRLEGAHRDRYLPVLTRRVDVLDDGGRAVKRAGPVKVRAKVTRRKGGRYEPGTALGEIGGFEVDPVNGLISFGGMVGNVSESTTDFRAKFQALGAGGVEVTFAHELHNHGAGEDAQPLGDYWAAAFTRDANGQVIDADLDAATAASAENVQVLSLPELVELRVGETSQNASQLRDHAELLAGRLLATGDEAELDLMLYRGFHAVTPGGVVDDVVYDLDRCTTRYQCRNFFVGPSRRLDMKALRQAATKAAKGSSAAANAPRSVAAGTRDYALQPLAAPGRFEVEVGGAAAGGEQGVCKITANGGDGTYTIEKLIWDHDAATWVTLEAGAAARDVCGRKCGRAHADQRTLWWEHTDDEGETIVLIDAVLQTAPFLCLVTKDGGAAGDAGTTCSWTYTVKALDDSTVLASGVTPEANRWPNCAYVYAGQGSASRYALAAYDGATLKLLVCYGEVQSTTVCTP